MTCFIRDVKKVIEHVDTANKRIQDLVRLLIELHPGLFNYRFAEGREHEPGLFSGLSTEDIHSIEQGLAVRDSLEDMRKILVVLRLDMVDEGGNDPDHDGDD